MNSWDGLSLKLEMQSQYICSLASLSESYQDLLCSRPVSSEHKRKEDRDMCTHSFLHFDFSPKLDRHYWTSIRTHMLHSIHNINLCSLLVLVLHLFPFWPLFLQPLLEPATVDAVRSLLPDYADGSLASLCTWADDIRWQYKWHWTSALHFIDTPDFLCRYNYDRKLITFFVCACLQRLWSFILLVSWIGKCSFSTKSCTPVLLSSST